MNNLKSYTEYAVTTPTTDFVIGFDFNYGTDAVNVTVDDVPATEAGYSVIYLNSTTMRLSPAVPTGVVRLQRETDIDVPDNQFTAGAKFIASNMDENFTQLRHAQQEVRDGFEKLSEDTYEIIDTLQVVGQAAQDAADAAEQAAELANDAAAQVSDKVPKSATLPTYLTISDGVDPVTGVADGAYFNVRSSSNESYIDEYQNVGGVATATGESYPSSQVIDRLQQGIKSITQLRLTEPYNKGDRIFLASVNEDQNEGGGEFIATQKAGLVDDGGLVIASPNPLLFWVRVNYDAVTPEMFGYDNVDGAITIPKAFASGRPLYLTGKEYRTSKPLHITKELKISGEGPEVSVITKFGADKVLINGEMVDCAVYSDGSLTNYYDGLDWSDFGIVKEPVIGADVGIALNLRYTQRSKFSSIYATGGEIAISSIDGWMIDWTRCEGRADTSWNLDTGTSNNIRSCWARNGHKYAWKIHNLDYSTLISCGADYCGRDGEPAEAVYHITNSHLSMISCGCEQIHAYNSIYVNYSWVTIIDPHFFTFRNKYSHPTDPTRRACISINHADTVVTMVGGHMQPQYNNTTTPVGIPHVIVNGSTLTTDGVFFIKEINDIRDSDWGFIIGAYSLVDYRYKGQHTVVDKRNADGSVRRKDYTDKALAFRHTFMNATSANVGRGLHDKFLFSQNFTDTNMVSGWGHIINMTNAVVDGDVWSSSAQLALSTQENRLSWRRGSSGNSYTAWMDLYHAAAHMIPNTNATYDVGATANRWKRAWLTNLNVGSLSVFADNAAAKAVGLVNGEVYRTASGQVMVVF